MKKKVDDAIVAVGKTKGLTVIVNEGAVVYGGVDVTADVQAELQKQARKTKLMKEEGPMRKLICLLVACLMVTAGCASLKNGLLSREVPRFAVVDWDRLVKQHPKYKVWQKQKTDLETAKALRERQLKDGHQQLAILGKMRSLAGKGRDRFRSAQLAAKVAEKEAQEQDLLQKKAESFDAAAESYVQKDREDVETRFRIPLFNVRLKLGSIKMSEAPKMPCSKKNRSFWISAVRPLRPSRKRKRRGSRSRWLLISAKAVPAWMPSNNPLRWIL